MTGDERVAYLVRLGMEAYDAEVLAKRRPSTADGAVRVADAREAFRAALEERMRQAAQTWTCEADADHVRTMTADHRRAIDALRRTHAAELSERYQRGYAAGLRVGRQGPPPPCPACGGTGAAHENDGSAPWDNPECSYCQGTGSKEPA